MAWAPTSSSASTSSTPGTVAISSRDERVDAGAAEQPADGAPHRGPRRVQPGPGVDLEHVEVAGCAGHGRRVRCGPPLPRATGGTGHAEDVGERVRRVGADEQGAPGVTRCGERGRRGDGRLADPALASHQQHSHGMNLPGVRTRPSSTSPMHEGQPSTRSLRPRSAVSTMTFSALRRMSPIIGMLTSTVELVDDRGASVAVVGELVDAVHRLEHVPLGELPGHRAVRRPSRTRGCRSP